ncbi:MAG: hypothetical protein ACFE9Z_14390 [Promethearchaeota archaeon]
MKSHILSKSIGLQHPNVRKVIEIANQIMAKNKILNIETLYNIAKKQLKIPRNGLLSIIHLLINKKILVEGSKFSRKTVLSNQIRQRIYKFIVMNPAIHFSYIRSMGLNKEQISSGQLIWHLEMLVKFNYIKKIKVGNYSVFLPFTMEDNFGELIFVMRNPINYKILKFLSENKSSLSSEIYKTINEKREDVYYRINYLKDKEIIIATVNSEVEITINPNKQSFISEILDTLKI